MISLRSAIVGSPETVRPGLEAFFERTGADEIMVTTKLFEHADRLRFYKILSHLMKELKVPEKTGTQAAS